MKFYFGVYFLLIAFCVSAQKTLPSNKMHLLDSLRDECFYKIEVVSESQDSKTRYIFTIGRAQTGFFTSGFLKKINTNCPETIRKTYRRQKLEKSQLDSLKRFELKLNSFGSNDTRNSKQTFLISTQADKYEYAIDGETKWDATSELLLILFRAKE